MPSFKPLTASMPWPKYRSPCLGPLASFFLSSTARTISFTITTFTSSENRHSRFGRTPIRSGVHILHKVRKVKRKGVGQSVFRGKYLDHLGGKKTSLMYNLLRRGRRLMKAGQSLGWNVAFTRKISTKLWRDATSIYTDTYHQSGIRTECVSTSFFSIERMQLLDTYCAKKSAIDRNLAFAHS